MNRIIFTLSLLTSLLLYNQLSNAQCHLADWTALKALYESTDGDNWVNNEGWVTMIANQTSPPANCDLSSPYGISLNNAGRVNALILLANNLQGNMPTEIRLLSELEDLLLNLNALTGSIPTEIGQLDKLAILVLEYNQLTGNIPTEIGNLTNLVQLHLSENNLSGEIPDEIGNLINLENLTLYKNQLTGSIPAELANLNNLTQLILAYNQLSGCYASELTPLCNQVSPDFLVVPPYPVDAISEANNFDTSWADFCATANGICAPTNNCRQTDSIALLSIYQSLKPNSGWDFSTTIDLWPGVSINESGCVDTLDLSEKDLTGMIPIQIGDFKEITYLDLNENSITGLIPHEIGNLTNLRYLSLAGNSITGLLPESLPRLNNLNRLYLSNNNISGCYPNQYINFYYQLYSKSNTNAAISDGNNFDAPWRDFCITGIGSCPIPPSICRETDSLALTNIYQSLKPTHTWNLSYPVSHWPGVRIINENGCVDKLDLSEHGLWGVIPPEIGDLSEITFLRMVENSIKGPLPDEIGNLNTLKVLSLSDNNMTGPVPKSLRNLINMEGLYLSDNQFTEVPSDIGNFSNLVNLYLSQNELNGCYPAEFAKLCNQLESNTNFAISSNNNFDASWEDFCQTNAGACLQSPSTVSTTYSGNQNPTVIINENGEYVLKNNDVQVFNFSTCSLTDIENCEPIKGFNDWAANEVLWAIEKGVQYITDNFGMSLPRVNCLVNSNHNSKPNSSFYNIDTKALIFGMGDGIERNTMTAPDIVGHELMHFVIANLNDDFCIYGECGALNESFADIFGEVLEYISRGSNDWVFGSEVLVANNSGIRSLSNPNDVTMQDTLPDTYLGNYWINQDNSALAGIHTNNGVQNYWFYLLANGGTGTNDHGLNYNVQGIGIEKAAEITFANLFNNLTPAATYRDAMYGSVNVAKELHGENSNEVQQTINAWEAVGLTALQTNPISWRVVNYEEGTPIGRELPIQFDLEIDSLGQDISADGLSFTLNLPPTYQNFKINNIYPPLTEEEVFIHNKSGVIYVSINRQSGGAQKTRILAQRIKSGAPILRTGGCLELADASSDCFDIPVINISGGTETITDNFANFESSSLLFGSECDEGGTFKRSKENLNDEILNVALQLKNQTCLNLGALEVEILDDLETGTIPYQYYLYNQNGEEIRSELQSFSPKYEFYNLEEGLYKLRVEDSANRHFIKNFEVKFTTGMNGSTCCPEKLIIPPGEHTGDYNAMSRISLKSGTRINSGRIGICDN